MKTIELPEIHQPQTPYTANIKALLKHTPAFACQIDMVDEQDFIQCLPTPSGGLTCQAAGNKGEPVFLHSKYDPKREADRWAEGVIKLAEGQQDEDNSRVPMCYVVDGFGLGYHVKALYDRLLGEAFILVSERNISLIRTALNQLDYSEMLESGRVIFLVRSDREEIFKKLQAHSTAMMLGVVYTRSLQQVDGEFHAAIHRMVNEYASFMRSHLISLIGNSIVTIKNILHNLPSYVGTSGINILKNRFACKPAVIVSAGPSLQRNITKLKEIRDKVVLIAVQTTLKPLLDMGIEPDFVTSLDYHEVSKRFFEGLTDEQLHEVHLVAEPKATWHVVDYVRQSGIVSLLGNEFARLVLAGEVDPHDNLPAGATVAHLAFYLAEYLGADPIIFVGQDLGFTDNLYYGPGTALQEAWKGELNRFCTIEMKQWERIARHKKILRQVEDIHGQKIYTDEQMFTYLQQFEKDFAHSSARVVDASEGGVRKQYCQTMSLQAATDEFCRQPVEREKFAYRKQINSFNTQKLQPARDAVKKRTEEVEELRGICVDTIEIVKEMLDLVDDQPMLNKKMVRLDELRTMVKHRNDTYRMVMLVSPTAEIYRFRQDRALGVDNVQGKDRQRRQLRRDIAYVTEIKNGCDRLLEMLGECVVRFDEEIEKHNHTKS